MSSTPDKVAPMALFEREKWEAEKAFREREISIKEQEQANKEAELGLKKEEQSASRWRNSLIVAIMAAAIATAGNAVLAFINGVSQRQLESQKSEQTRILEMIKTANPDKAADNLDFLLRTGLISDPNIQKKLSEYLANRKPGSGPTLPLPAYESYEKEHPSFKEVSSEWLAASNQPDKSVNAIWVRFASKAGKAYKAIHVFHHPSGPYVLLCSTDKDREDFSGVEVALAQAYQGIAEGRISDRGDDICDVVSVASGFTQKGVAKQVDTFFRRAFDRIAIEAVHY